MSTVHEKINLIKEHIKDYPDFPKPGVLFRDIFSVFQDPKLTKILRDVMVETARSIKPAVECVVGVDARGFLLGPLIALELNIPFVPIRKKGKLPGKVCSAAYSLEYGEDILQIQEGSIKKNQTVLIVDDLIATGGSLGTACKLVEKLGGKVANCLVLMELTELKGRAQVPVDVLALIKY